MFIGIKLHSAHQGSTFKMAGNLRLSLVTDPGLRARVFISSLHRPFQDRFALLTAWWVGSQSKCVRVCGILMVYSQSYFSHILLVNQSQSLTQPENRGHSFYLW